MTKADVLSKKLLRRLQIVARETERPLGIMYRGTPMDIAPVQHSELIRRGLAYREVPHNPVHKVRVVVSDAGLAALRAALRAAGYEVPQ